MLKETVLQENMWIGFECTYRTYILSRQTR